MKTKPPKACKPREIPARLTKRACDQAHHGKLGIAEPYDYKPPLSENISPFFERLKLE